MPKSGFNESSGRLVIRAPNWLGDAVMALPALAAVRTAMPDTHITIAAISAVAPVFGEDTPAAPDSVVTIADRRSEQGPFRRRIRRRTAADKFLRSAWTMRQAGIAQRWGYSANCRGFL
jgi:heptosyltransferase-2